MKESRLREILKEENVSTKAYLDNINKNVLNSLMQEMENKVRRLIIKANDEGLESVEEIYGVSDILKFTFTFDVAFAEISIARDFDTVPRMEIKCNGYLVEPTMILALYMNILKKAYVELQTRLNVLERARISVLLKTIPNALFG